jgi:hypothetical protein
MTNKEFSELSPEEVTVYFKGLSAEEVETLTKDQKAAYDEFVAKQSTPSFEAEEGDQEKAMKIARAYFEAHPKYDHDSIFVTSDGSLFYPTLKGKNAADNHASLNKLAMFEVKK